MENLIFYIVLPWYIEPGSGKRQSDRTPISSLNESSYGLETWHA